MAENVYPRIYGVAEINLYLQEYLAEDEFLSLIAIRGEISGFRAHASGHVYFTLKDQDSSIRVVMFRRFAQQMIAQVQDGDQVVVIGSVSLYQRDGSCQLYAQEILPAGGGEQAKALAELKARLDQEGIFAEERKQPLPRFVFNIGVVTAKQGAAWADIQRIALGRNPHLQMRLYPALVQGDQAAESLATALGKADKGGHDLVIIGRGGGGQEDLAAFDTEQVVRAIAAAQTPIIAAVGHESDFSLSDLAADLRAATPTHAASLAVTALAEVESMLGDIDEEMAAALKYYLDNCQQRLDSYDLCKAADSALAKHHQRLLIAITRLTAINPVATLSRGYAVIEDKAGTTVRQADQVKPGDLVKIYPAKGRILAIVEEVADD